MAAHTLCTPRTPDLLLLLLRPRRWWRFAHFRSCFPASRLAAVLGCCTCCNCCPHRPNSVLLLLLMMMMMSCDSTTQLLTI
jgi:hypothetical protein